MLDQLLKLMKMMVVEAKARWKEARSAHRWGRREPLSAPKNSSICQHISFSAAKIALHRSLILLVSFDCIAVSEWIALQHKKGSLWEISHAKVSAHSFCRSILQEKKTTFACWSVFWGGTSLLRVSCCVAIDQWLRLEEWLPGRIGYIKAWAQNLLFKFQRDCSHP